MYVFVCLYSGYDHVSRNFQVVTLNPELSFQDVGSLRASGS